MPDLWSANHSGGQQQRLQKFCLLSTRPIGWQRGYENLRWLGSQTFVVWAALVSWFGQETLSHYQ
jgi:hypothetical protein